MTLKALKHIRRKLQGIEAAAAQAVQREQKKVDDEKFRVRECERHVDDARDRAALDAALLALDSVRKDHA
jgi:flavin-binding protein dodecin